MIGDNLRAQMRRDLKDDCFAKSIPPMGLGQFSWNDEDLFFGSRLYIPLASRLVVVKRFHDEPLSGHPGRLKTLLSLSRWCFFPKMRKYIDRYVETCQVCARSKPLRQQPAGLLQPLPVPERPWSSISMDFITDLPMSNSFDSVLVVVDRFSKMAHFIPCVKSVNAAQVAELFFTNIVRLHGLPRDIVSDRGSVFTSLFWRSLLKLLQVDRNLSTAFHPQSDGQTERVNQILEQYLRCYLDYNQDNWFQLLPFAEFAYNSQSHSSLSVSPFETVFGYQPVLDHSLTVSDNSGFSIHAQDRIVLLKEQFEYLRSELLYAQSQMEKFANRDRREIGELQVGELVWLDRKNIKTSRPSQKLDFKRFGPFKIKRIISKVAYELDLPPSFGMVHPVFHVSLLSRAKIDPDRVDSQPPPVLVDSELEYWVDEILDSRIHRRRLEYLVSWYGYGPEHNSWEPTVNLTHAEDAVKLFHERFPDKPKSVPLRHSGSYSQISQSSPEEGILLRTQSVRNTRRYS